MRLLRRLPQRFVRNSVWMICGSGDALIAIVADGYVYLAVELGVRSERIYTIPIGRPRRAGTAAYARQDRPLT